MIKSTRSDNTSPTHRKAARAFYNASVSRWPDIGVYGDDSATKKLQTVMQEITGRECIVRPVYTGTGGNCIIASTLADHKKPKQRRALLCEPHAHMATDEQTAPEADGLTMIPSKFGSKRIETTWKKLVRKIENYTALDKKHGPMPCGVVIAQVDERGRVFSHDEISSLCRLAHSHGMFVYMDGARFANAAAALDGDIKKQCSDLDGLTFGASKNGGGIFDAMVLFKTSFADSLEENMKHDKQLSAQMYVPSSGLLPYFEDNLWLDNAKNANKMAQILRQKLGIEEKPGYNSNTVFCHLPGKAKKRLQKLGHNPYEWEKKTHLYRLVTSWDMKKGDVEQVADIILEEAEGDPNWNDAVLWSRSGPT